MTVATFTGTHGTTEVLRTRRGSYTVTLNGRIVFGCTNRAQAEHVALSHARGDTP